MINDYFLDDKHIDELVDLFTEAGKKENKSDIRVDADTFNYLTKGEVPDYVTMYLRPEYDKR